MQVVFQKSSVQVDAAAEGVRNYLYLSIQEELTESRLRVFQRLMIKLQPV
jgi:hypothetical protein